jgi:hypothetical protein
LWYKKKLSTISWKDYSWLASLMAREWPKYWNAIKQQTKKNKEIEKKEWKNLTHGISAEYPK